LSQSASSNWLSTHLTVSWLNTTVTWSQSISTTEFGRTSELDYIKQKIIQDSTN
jgi:hypothetical protein